MPISATVPEAVQARINADSKLEGQTYSKSFEVKDPYVYYDTYVLNASAAPTVLFNNASAKARSLSNYQYQQLPSGQAFDVYALRVAYVGITAFTDVVQLALVAFLNNAVLNIQINNKVPAYERNIGSLVGGQIQVVTAPAVTVASRNLSVWTGNTVVKFKEKIKLDQQTQWVVNIVKDVANAATLTGDFLRVEMIGRLTSKL